MGRMPSLPRLGRGRLSLAAVLATAALVALLTPAQAELPSAEVTIVSPKGQEVFVRLDQLDPDFDTKVDIRAREKAERRVEIEEGVSIWRILESKSLDDDYSFVEIERPNGTTLRIASDDVDDAFFYQGADGKLRFLRVSRDPEDYNARDHFEIAGAAVTLTQTVELEVDLSADRRKVEPGESVDFDVEVSGAPAGARYRFSWSFGDGTRESSTSPRRSHVFDEQGVHSVTVSAGVRGSDLSGDSDIVDIEVGDPKQPEDDVPSGSGTSGGDGYVPSSPAPAPATPYTPIVPPTPSTPAPPPTDLPDLPAIETDGTTVEGNLLADVSNPAASSSVGSAARAAADRKPKEAADESGGVPEAAFASVAVLALLGLGAGIETRQGRLPRPRLRLPLPRRAA